MSYADHAARITFADGSTVDAASLHAGLRILSEYKRAQDEGRTVTVKDGVLHISGLPDKEGK